MTPPPIRYPLPTLAVLALILAVAWAGKGRLAALGGPIRAAIDRVVSGPPVPSSAEPERLAGPIVRRVLVLGEGVVATDAPGGGRVETINRRVFADVYDRWPMKGEPTHYRIGNRRPFGWVEAGEVLPWDTRLVVRAPGGELTLRADPSDGAGEAVRVGGAPCPVVGWMEGAVLVAAWEPGEPWRRVGRIGWARMEELGDGAFGVLLSRFELLELLRRVLGGPEETPGSLRLDAVLGRLAGEAPLTPDEIGAARAALPGAILGLPLAAGESPADRLSRLNDDWVAEASWSGIAYRSVPIDAIPGG